jgi:hypothetical protein
MLTVAIFLRSIMVVVIVFIGSGDVCAGDVDYGG